MTSPTARATPAMVPAPPRPPIGGPREWIFPRPARHALPNGLRVVVAAAPRLPLVTGLLLLDAGAAADPTGREGVAQLAARLVTEGTEALDSERLTERLESLGTGVDAHADWDAATIRCTAHRDRFADALALLADVVRRPRLDAAELERLRAERLSDLLQLRAEPRGLADEHFARTVYAESSRYAHPEGGSEESVRRVSLDDVRAFHAARWRPAGGVLILAGDVTSEEGLLLAERLFGDWAGAAPAPVVPDTRPGRETRRLVLVDKPEAAQSEVRVGHVGIPRDHPDYFPVLVMNAILGGIFSSRINLNLREEHGYTYGAFSGFDWRRAPGPFEASSAVRSDATAASVREVMKELERIREAPVTPDELSLATSYLDGVFPLRYETTSAIAGALASQLLYGLADDYFDRYRERVRAVTADDVLRAARTHLRPEAAQVVVVGSGADVRADLAALGWPMDERTAED